MISDFLNKALTGGATPRGIVVLMYHALSDKRHANWKWEVTRANFAAQLDYLRQHAIDVFPVSRLLEPDCPSRGVVITFDDGYANNMAAAELLRAKGMTASWYVSSQFIGGHNAWANQTDPRLPMLSRGDLNTLAEWGMEIGAHSRSHCDLPRQSADRVVDEVRGSKQDLEDILGRPVESFAYPFGRHNDEIVAATRAAGYRTACTTRSGWYRPSEDKLLIRRVTIYGADGLGEFARKIAFADNDVGWRRMLRYSLNRLTRRSV
jgi:peptidoglycan/xylan/chitin deacetylase (PgdA/CDA1 family)